MKAMILNSKSGPEALMLADLPRPRPGAGEVLVQVHATALTPSELQWKPTFSSRSGQPRQLPIVLGHEFSGVIAEIGPGVGGYELGDEVYGLNDWFTNGAEAEYCVAPAAAIARKPLTLDHVQAATVPISALTAWQALAVRGRLSHGQTILIHGAAGAVGLFAVQIAREAGARVFATGATEHHDLLRSLGADVAIDYRNVRFEDVVRDADLVFDTVGGETLKRSWSVIRPGGVVVTIAAQSEGALDRRTREAFMLMEPDHAQLAALADVIDAGRRRVFVAAEYPLTEARAAYASAARRQGYGKTVLRVISPPAGHN